MNPFMAKVEMTARFSRVVWLHLILPTLSLPSMLCFNVGEREAGFILLDC
jgi:hypothetical protein